jgi:hypothetical protein
MKEKFRPQLTCAGAMAILMGAALVLACGFCAGFPGDWQYTTKSFHGDGTLEDTGFFSYPRYHARFAKIPLGQVGDYSFTCQGLPPVPLRLTLNLDGNGDYDTLTKLDTVVSCSVLDEEGKTVASAAGPLRDWTLAWVPANATGYYYRRDLREFELNSRRTYQLNVAVRDVDKKSPAIHVVPTLQGGGKELP